MDHNEGRARIQDVARRARVSIATASRSLNNFASVDVMLANRVRRAADELDYIPNANAKALAQGGSRLLGLIISESLAHLLPTFESFAAREEYSILIGFADNTTPAVNRCMSRMLAQNVAGIAVVLPPEQNLSAALPLLGKTPLVSLAQGPIGPRSSILEVNYQSGMREAIRHLAALGHRDMALLNGPGASHFCQQMLAAYRISLEDLGLSCGLGAILECDTTPENCAQVVRERMSHPHRPTAIIAADHPMAAAVLSAATDLGLRVPHDLSVVAFAGMRGDPPESPAMTSIEISTEDIVRATLSALHIGRERKNSQALNPLRVLTRLVIRQSTDQIRSFGEHPAIL